MLASTFPHPTPIRYWSLLLPTLLCGTALGGPALIGDEELRNHDLVRYWQATIPLEPNEEIRAVHQVQENLYCFTNKGTAFAVHAAVGIIRWSIHCSDPAHPVFPPSHVPDQPGKIGAVLLTTPSDLYIVDRSSGEVQHKLTLPVAASGSAVTDGNMVYFGAVNSRLHCMSLPEFFVNWRITTRQPVSTLPILSGGNLYFASQDGQVYACTAADKRRLWVFDMGMPTGGQPVLHPAAGLLIAGGTGRAVFALDPAAGPPPKWRARTNGAASDGPWATAGAIYQYSQGQGVFAIDPKGDMKWLLPEGRSFIAEIGGLAFLRGVDNNLYAVEIATGRKKYSIPADEVAFAVPGTSDSALVLAGHDGRVLCVRDRNTPYLRSSLVQAALEKTSTTQPAATGPASAPAARLISEPKPGARKPPERDSDENPLETSIRSDPLGVSRPNK